MSFVNAWSSPTGTSTASINVVCDASDTVSISGVTAAIQYQPNVSDGVGGGINGGFSLALVTGLSSNTTRTATINVNGSPVQTVPVRPMYSGKPKRYYTAITLGCERPDYDSDLLVDVLDRLEAGELYDGVTSADLIIHLGDLTYKGWQSATPETRWGQTTVGTDNGAPYANAIDTSDQMLWAQARVGVARAGQREAFSRVPAVFQRDDHETANNWPIPSPTGIPNDPDGMGFSDKYVYTGAGGDGTGTNINQDQVDAIIDNKKIANRFLMAANPGTEGADSEGDEEDFYFTEMGIKWLVSDTSGRSKEQTGVGNRIVSDAQQTRLIDNINDSSPDILIHATPKTYWKTNGDGWADFASAVGTPYNGSNGQLLEFLEEIPDGTTQRFTSITSDRHWGFAGVGQQEGIDFAQLNPGAGSQTCNGTNAPTYDNGRPPADARGNGDWRTFGVSVIVYDTQTQKLNIMAVGYDGQILYSQALEQGTNIPVEDNPMAEVTVGREYVSQTIDGSSTQSFNNDVMFTSKVTPNDLSPDVDPTLFTVPTGGAVLTADWFAGMHTQSGSGQNAQIGIYPWNGSDIVAENLAAESSIEPIPAGVNGESPPNIVAFSFAGETLPAGEYVALVRADGSNIRGAVESGTFDTDCAQQYAAAGASMPDPAPSADANQGDWPFFLWGEISTIGGGTTPPPTLDTPYSDVSAKVGDTLAPTDYTANFSGADSYNSSNFPDGIDASDLTAVQGTYTRQGDTGVAIDAINEGGTTGSNQFTFSIDPEGEFYPSKTDVITVAVATFPIERPDGSSIIKSGQVDGYIGVKYYSDAAGLIEVVPGGVTATVEYATTEAPLDAATVVGATGQRWSYEGRATSAEITFAGAGAAYARVFTS